MPELPWKRVTHLQQCTPDVSFQLENQAKAKHAPPNNDLQTLDLPLRTVNIRDFLPELELYIFLGGDAFNLDEGCGEASAALYVFVPEDTALGIESGKGQRGWGKFGV
jgi:hypothetical protein